MNKLKKTLVKALLIFAYKIDKITEKQGSWTKFDEYAIIELADCTTDRELSEIMNKTKQAIKSKRYRLNLKETDTIEMD